MSNPIFKKPLGPSKLGSYGGERWNNLHMGTDGPITCEICGTNHSERKDETYLISRFLDRQVVEECCGAIIDWIFRESGEEFAEAFLRGFSKNPTDSRYCLFLERLISLLRKAEKNLKETSEKNAKALVAAEKLKK